MTMARPFWLLYAIALAVSASGTRATRRLVISESYNANTTLTALARSNTTIHISSPTSASPLKPSVAAKTTNNVAKPELGSKTLVTPKNVTAIAVKLLHVNTPANNSGTSSQSSLNGTSVSTSVDKPANISSVSMGGEVTVGRLSHNSTLENNTTIQGDARSANDTLPGSGLAPLPPGAGGESGAASSGAGTVGGAGVVGPTGSCEDHACDELCARYFPRTHQHPAVYMGFCHGTACMCA